MPFDLTPEQLNALSDPNTLRQLGSVPHTNAYDPFAKYAPSGVNNLYSGDTQDYLASQQTAGQQAWNGLVKALGTTASVVGSTFIEPIFGIGSMLGGGSYWDNAYSKYTDDMMDHLRDTHMNFYSQEQRDAAIISWENLSSANFWFDKVANGAAFTIGAAISMMATGGAGVIGTAGKLANLGGKMRLASALGRSAVIAEEGVAASLNIIKAANEGRKFTQLANLKNALRTVDAVATAGLAESSIEAREGYKEGLSNSIERIRQELGREPTSEELEHIQKYHRAGANVNFIVNMVVTGATNYYGVLGPLIKSKAFGLIDDLPTNAVRLTPGQSGLTSVLNKMESVAPRGLNKLLNSKTANFLSKSGSEGSQELLQGLSSVSTQSMADEKVHFGKSYFGALADALPEVAKEMQTKERLEEGFIGALIGGGGSVISMVRGTDEVSQKKKNTNQLIDQYNEMIPSIKNALGKTTEEFIQKEEERLNSASKVFNSAEKLANAQSGLDSNKMRKNFIGSIVQLFGKHDSNRLQTFIDGLDSLAENENFAQELGLDPSAVTAEERVKIIEDLKKEVNSAYRQYKETQAEVYVKAGREGNKQKNRPALISFADNLFNLRFVAEGYDEYTKSVAEQVGDESTDGTPVEIPKGSVTRHDLMEAIKYNEAVKEFDEAKTQREEQVTKLQEQSQKEIEIRNNKIAERETVETELQDAQKEIDDLQKEIDDLVAKRVVPSITAQERRVYQIQINKLKENLKTKKENIAKVESKKSAIESEIEESLKRDEINARQIDVAQKRITALDEIIKKKREQNNIRPNSTGERMNKLLDKAVETVGEDKTADFAKYVAYEQVLAQAEKLGEKLTTGEIASTAQALRKLLETVGLSITELEEQQEEKTPETPINPTGVPPEQQAGQGSGQQPGAGAGNQGGQQGGGAQPGSGATGGGSAGNNAQGTPDEFTTGGEAVSSLPNEIDIANASNFQQQKNDEFFVLIVPKTGKPFLSDLGSLKDILDHIRITYEDTKILVKEFYIERNGKVEKYDWTTGTIFKRVIKGNQQQGGQGNKPVDVGQEFVETIIKPIVDTFNNATDKTTTGAFFNFGKDQNKKNEHLFNTRQTTNESIKNETKNTTELTVKQNNKNQEFDSLGRVEYFGVNEERNLTLEQQIEIFNKFRFTGDPVSYTNGKFIIFKMRDRVYLETALNHNGSANVNFTDPGSFVIFDIKQNKFVTYNPANIEHYKVLFGEQSSLEDPTRMMFESHRTKVNELIQKRIDAKNADVTFGIWLRKVSTLLNSNDRKTAREHLSGSYNPKVLFKRASNGSITVFSVDGTKLSDEDKNNYMTKFSNKFEEHTNKNNGQPLNNSYFMLNEQGELIGFDYSKSSSSVSQVFKKALNHYFTKDNAIADIIFNKLQELQRLSETDLEERMNKVVENINKYNATASKPKTIITIDDILGLSNDSEYQKLNREFTNLFTLGVMGNFENLSNNNHSNIKIWFGQLNFSKIGGATDNVEELTKTLIERLNTFQNEDSVLDTIRIEVEFKNGNEKGSKYFTLNELLKNEKKQVEKLTAEDSFNVFQTDKNNNRTMFPARLMPSVETEQFQKFSQEVLSEDDMTILDLIDNNQGNFYNFVIDSIKPPANNQQQSQSQQQQQPPTQPAPSNVVEPEPQTQAQPAEKTPEEIANETLNALGLNNKPDDTEDTNAAPFQIVDETEHFEFVDQQEAIDELKKVLGDNVVVDDIAKVVNNSKTNGVALGAVLGGIVYLAKRVVKGTGYHEAFHSVFRGSFNKKSQQQMLNSAEIESGFANMSKEQKKEALDSLRNKSELYKNLSTQQLTDLWLEEWLADKFMNYAKNRDVNKLPTKNRSLFRALWERLLRLMRFLSNPTNSQLINQTFKDLYEGKYANQKRDSFGDTTAFMLLPITKERFLDPEVTKDIINTVTANVLLNKPILKEGVIQVKDELEEEDESLFDEDEQFEFNPIDVLNQLANLTNEYFNQERDKALFISGKMSQEEFQFRAEVMAAIKNNKSAIIEAINARLKQAGKIVNTLDDESNVDQLNQLEEDEKMNLVKKGLGEDGGFGSIPKQARMILIRGLVMKNISGGVIPSMFGKRAIDPEALHKKLNNLLTDFQGSIFDLYDKLKFIAQTEREGTTDSVKGLVEYLNTLSQVKREKVLKQLKSTYEVTTLQATDVVVGSKTKYGEGGKSGGYGLGVRTDLAGDEENITGLLSRWKAQYNRVRKGDAKIKLERLDLIINELSNLNLSEAESLNEYIKKIEHAVRLRQEQFLIFGIELSAEYIKLSYYKRDQDIIKELEEKALKEAAQSTTPNATTFNTVKQFTDFRASNTLRPNVEYLFDKLITEEKSKSTENIDDSIYNFIFKKFRLDLQEGKKNPSVLSKLYDRTDIATGEKTAESLYVVLRRIAISNIQYDNTVASQTYQDATGKTRYNKVHQFLTSKLISKIRSINWSAIRQAASFIQQRQVVEFEDQNLYTKEVNELADELATIKDSKPLEKPQSDELKTDNAEKIDERNRQAYIDEYNYLLDESNKRDQLSDDMLEVLDQQIELDSLLDQTISSVLNSGQSFSNEDIFDIFDELYDIVKICK